MPITKDEFKAIYKRSHAVQKEHSANYNDWIWSWIADPDTFVLVNETHEVFVGRKELEPWFDARAKLTGRMSLEDPEEPEIYMNYFGPGMHVVSYVSKRTRDAPMAPGLPTVSYHRTTITFNDDGKWIRLVSLPADEETSLMFELLMEGKEKRDGVPEGGYPETVKLFKRNVDAINKGADAVAPLLADDCVYIVPTGHVHFGKTAVDAGIRGWYALGLKHIEIVDPIRTPTKDTCWTMIRHTFADNTPAPKGNAMHPVFSYCKFDLATGKVKVLANIASDLEHAAWIGKWLNEFVPHNKQETTPETYLHAARDSTEAQERSIEASHPAAHLPPGTPGASVYLASGHADGVPLEQGAAASKQQAKLQQPVLPEHLKFTGENTETYLHAARDSTEAQERAIEASHPSAHFPVGTTGLTLFQASGLAEGVPMEKKGQPQGGKKEQEFASQGAA